MIPAKNIAGKYEKAKQMRQLHFEKESKSGSKDELRRAEFQLAAGIACHSAVMAVDCHSACMPFGYNRRNNIEARQR